MVLVLGLLLCPEEETGREGFCFGSQRNPTMTLQPGAARGWSSETQHQRRNRWAGLSKAFEHSDTNSSGL